MTAVFVSYALYAVFCLLIVLHVVGAIGVPLMWLWLCVNTVAFYAVRWVARKRLQQARDELRALIDLYVAQGRGQG
jgi:hypothetical protein